MFKKLWDVLKKRNVLEKALADTTKMIKISKKQFKNAFKSLLENDNDLAKKVIKKDKKLNDLKIKVRERTLGYLVGSTEVDLSYTILILDAATNLERVGDYCTEISGLVISYPKPIDREDTYHGIILKCYDAIYGMFDRTEKAVDKDSDRIAKEMIAQHKNTVRTLTNEIIDKLNTEDHIKTKRAIRLALLSHLFRRISAHLANISESVITPIHK